MLDSEIPPNVWTFNVLVSALSKLGMLKEAEELIEIMEERDMVSDVVTHRILITRYCLRGWMEEARRIFNAMVDRAVHPDTH
ncbi:hypothetical protein RHMOL_Rhmol08G0199900 [Rhododendron molle]|uniref:Uncharacterized protein n=1 Tax=Rhododendron molle TaxID=49168 RepID=A0ACC0MRN7_RHOML|nr:hypothetical protein RHMOL_Rhmol08G0199900 [Rhododendron molle]